MRALLLDSNILIDQLNGVPQAQAFLESHRLACFISPVTRAEVIAGAQGDQRRIAVELLDVFPCLSVDEAVGDHAGSIRQENGLKLADAFQMALAELNGCQFVTRDLRDFKKRPAAPIHIPYSL